MLCCTCLHFSLYSTVWLAGLKVRAVSLGLKRPLMLSSSTPAENVSTAWRLFEAVPGLRILREDACLMPSSEEQQEAHFLHEAKWRADLLILTESAAGTPQSWSSQESFEHLTCLTRTSCFLDKVVETGLNWTCRKHSNPARSDNSAEDREEAQRIVQLSKSLEALSSVRRINLQIMRSFNIQPFSSCARRHLRLWGKTPCFESCGSRAFQRYH